MQQTIITDASVFDFVKALLTDKKTYAKYTDKLKDKNFFMCMRMIAKQYPLQVNAVNLNGINKVGILDFFHFRLCKDGQYPPKWLRVSGGSENVTKEEKLIKEIKKDTKVCLMLLEHLGVEYKSLIELIYADFVMVEREYNNLLLSISGKMKKTQKLSHV